jgi:hypothetical protein
MTTQQQPSAVNAAQTGSDDGLHVPDTDRRWRESYYFSFFDTRHGIGGFTSIGRRPESGHIGSINVLWGPERPTLVAAELGSSVGHALPYEVHGLSYDSSGEFGDWSLRFAGPMNDGSSEVVCEESAIGSALDNADAVAVTYDLTFHPSTPAYIYAQNDAWLDLFTGHVDEIGTVTGTVTIGGETIEIDGHGGKDHSWGVRDWYKPQEWRWVDLVATDGPEFAMWRATFDGSEWVEDGAVFVDGRTVPITSYSETIEEIDRARKPRPVRWSMRTTTSEGELALSGDVVRIAPITFSQTRDGLTRTSWNDRALVRCELEGAGVA